MRALAFTPGLWLAVDALAVARLTRLVTKDTISNPIRARVHRRSVKAFDFLSCPWCTSVWIAAAVVGLTVGIGSWWRYPAALLSMSMVAGFLAGHE